MLGPTYGGPLEKLIMFQPSGVADSLYLAYSTRDKVIGLSALPLDGDPNKAMGLIAHPGQVTGLAVTYDGRRILTVCSLEPRPPPRFLGNSEGGGA